MTFLLQRPFLQAPRHTDRWSAALAALLCVAVLASGCGDDEAPSGADGGADVNADAIDAGDGAADVSDDAVTPITLPQWCRESNTILCGWMFRCFADPDMRRARAVFGFEDYDGCLEVFVASCQTRTIGGVNDGRQVFDGANAAMCVAALDEERCGTFAQLESGAAMDPAACDAVTEGQQLSGEECITNSDCNAPYARCVEDECTGELGGPSFLEPCDPTSEESVFGCGGRRCLQLAPGSVSAGICTSQCTVDENCGPGGVCVTDNSGDQFCLASCESDADCGVFSCVQASATVRACISVPE